MVEDETEPSLRLAGSAKADLPNGCFIESYVTLRMLVARGVPVREPRLLSY